MFKQALITTTSLFFIFNTAFAATPKQKATNDKKADAVKKVSHKQGGNELVLHIPKNWKLQTSVKKKDFEIYEYFVKDKNKKDWTHMVSIQILPKPGEKATASALLHVLGKKMQQLCPQAQMKYTQARGGNPKMSNRAMGYFTCPKVRKTDTGRVIYYQAIAGKNAMFLVQQTWKVTAFTGDKIPNADKIEYDANFFFSTLQFKS